MSIDKGEAVPYRDLVTILRTASMQYKTKLATTQRQNKVMYTVDASMRSEKTSPVHKIVLTDPWPECPAL